MRHTRSNRHAATVRAAATAVEQLETRTLMTVTTAEPYLVATAPAVEVTPLLTVGDAVGGYRMVGIPDGLGAYDNGDGTFTVLMNHELASNLGVARDHGAKGSFVSKWVVDKATLNVVSGDDLIKKLYTWDVATQSFILPAADANPSNDLLAAMNRLCSADLPETSAFYNPATGLGTTSRIFMNGEETGDGRAFAHVVTGPEAGSSWELPWTGKYAWENHVTSPHAQDKTIVMGLDDSSRNFSTEGAANPSEVYVWVGDKKAAGLEIDKAGLRDGVLHGLRVGLPGAYDANESTVASGERFELVGLTDQTNNATFAPLQAESIAKSITQFRRVEDGHFDPTNANVFYFVTTDQFGGSTRLWKLTFDDITAPEAGGKIEVAVDSPAAVMGEMFDNMTVNANGDVLLQEDPGNNPYLAKVWQWDASSGDLVQVAQHNPALFGTPAAADLYPAIPGVQSTQDEESSGIIELSDILGPGTYLADVQAHYRFTGGTAGTDPSGELVEAGQLLVIDTNAATATLAADGTLSVQGTINDDDVEVTRHGQTLSVSLGGESLGTFDAKSVRSVVVDAGAGDDAVSVGNSVQAPAALLGGLGDDVLSAGGGSSILVGGVGADELNGGAKEDLLIGGTTTANVAGALTKWNGPGNHAARVSSLRSTFNAASIAGDGADDVIAGGGSKDWFFRSGGDVLTDRQSSETLN